MDEEEMRRIGILFGDFLMMYMAVSYDSGSDFKFR